MVVFLTLIISVFLIILTLREGSKQYDREGEKMLQCSIQISRIYNTFQGLSPEVQDERRIEFTDEYSRVLDSFSLNHRDIDYLQFQLRNRSELHIGRIQYLVDLVKYGILSIAEYWLYLSLVIIPPLATFLLRHQLGF